MGANLMAEETSGDKKGILLETGTNEFEIVEFSIGNVNYGINVAKVREVITRAPVTVMPQEYFSWMIFLISSSFSFLVTIIRRFIGHLVV